MAVLILEIEPEIESRTCCNSWLQRMTHLERCKVMFKPTWRLCSLLMSDADQICRFRSFDNKRGASVSLSDRYLDRHGAIKQTEILK